MVRLASRRRRGVAVNHMAAILAWPDGGSSPGLSQALAAPRRQLVRSPHLSGEGRSTTGRLGEDSGDRRRRDPESQPPDAMWTTRDTHRPPRTPVIEARTLGIDNNTKALISHQNKSYPEDSGDHTNMQINPNSLITKVLSDKPSSPCQKQGGSRRGNGRWARSTTYCLHTVGRQP
jgi:hypothetical protein